MSQPLPHARTPGVAAIAAADYGVRASGPDSGLLDIDGAAARLGISARFVRRLVAERRIPFYKVGRFVRFSHEDLEVWLESRHVVVREPVRYRFTSRQRARP
jgi:excisionase family DNA binding protein